MKVFTQKKLFQWMLAGTLGLTSCLAFAGPKDNSLNVGFQREVVNLDYLYTTSQEHIVISDLTDERLFEVDLKTNDVVPALAVSYQYLDDKTLQIKLRQGVKFHDGTPFTADDVVYTYQWLLNPEGNTRAAGTTERWLASVEKVDDYTVNFKLKAVYPLVLRDMARRIPIRKNNSYLVNGKVDRGAQAIKPIGLGPYRVVSFEPGQKAVLERFDGYYQGSPKGQPTIQRMVIRTIPDWGTQQAELMSGGLDWTYDMPLDVAESMAASGQVKHLSGSSLRVSFVIMDAKPGPDNPFSDIRVRQAFNHAVNVPEITEFLIGGAAQPMKAACHPIQFGCIDDAKQYPYDIAKAKALLKQANYNPSKPIELWAYRDRSVAEAVVASLKEAGFNVNLRYAQLASLDQARAEGKIHAYIGSWANGATADTAMIARIHFGDTDRNMTGNDKLKSLVFAAEETNDVQKRKDLYREALTIIADQAYWVPMFAYSVNYLQHQKLDLTPSSDGLPRLYEARWK